MGQAVIHDELALGLLLFVNLDAMSDAIKARCEQTGSALRMQRVDSDDYGAWAQTIFKPLILTLLTNGSASTAPAGGERADPRLSNEY